MLNNPSVTEKKERNFQVIRLSVENWLKWHLLLTYSLRKRWVISPLCEQKQCLFTPLHFSLLCANIMSDPFAAIHNTIGLSPWENRKWTSCVSRRQPCVMLSDCEAQATYLSIKQKVSTLYRCALCKNSNAACRSLWYVLLFKCSAWTWQWFDP